MIRTRTRGANSSLDGACSCSGAPIDSANNTARHAIPGYFPIILNMLRDLLVSLLLLYRVDSHLSILPAARWDSQEEAVHSFALPSKISGSSSAQRSGNFGEEPIMVRVVHLKNVDQTLSSGHVNPSVLGIIVQIIGVLGAG